MTAQDPRPDTGLWNVPAARVRSVSLWLIALLLAFHTLVAASSLIIPIHLAILANLALSPVVRGLERARLPPPVSAAMVLASTLLLFVVLASAIATPASEWVARAPASLAEIEGKLRAATRPLEEVSRATQSVEDLVEIERDTASVKVRTPGLLWTLLTGTQNLVAYGAVVIVLLYFLLSGGDGFLRKLVTVLPSLSDKKRAVEIARRTEREISRYLFTVSVINVSLALTVAAAMALIGMPNPLLWGALVGALNFVPFLGPMVGVTLIGGAAVLSFDSLEAYLLPPAVAGGITALEGLLITPALLGRRLTLSPVVVFLSVLVLSWAWGVIGALVAVPSLVMIKIVCAEVEPLRPIGLLMEAEPRA